MSFVELITVTLSAFYSCYLYSGIKLVCGGYWSSELKDYGKVH